jgi:aspartate kinase
VSLIVQKFGGTSLQTPLHIKRVAERIIRVKREGNEVVIVVSAMGETTDELIKLANQITPHPNKREMDMLLSTGEQVSCALMALAINSLGEPAISLTGPQVEIITDTVHTKARICKVNTERILMELKAGKIVVVAGFQGISLGRDITTLGRGGSDTTAVALAAALEAQACEIYTDVDGVYTANPRIVQNARKLDFISCEEMLELASVGSRVLHSRCVELAKKFGVVIHVRSSFNERRGTIVKELEDMEEVVVRGIAEDTNQAKVTILDVPDQPGVAAKIFNALSEENINVDMIVQSAAENGKNDISFTVGEEDIERTLEIMQGVKEELNARDVTSDSNVAKVSVVGVGMRSHSGVAAKMFSALAKNGINIQMISTSEIKISCIIRKDQIKSAVNALHQAFELESKEE